MVSSACFGECRCVPHVVNYSYGTPLHEVWKMDLRLQVRRSLPFMMEMGLLTGEQASSLEQRIELEIDHPHFHALQPFLTVWGKKMGEGVVSVLKRPQARSEELLLCASS
jgi:hypothetical protein